MLVCHRLQLYRKVATEANATPLTLIEVWVVVVKHPIPDSNLALIKTKIINHNRGGNATIPARKKYEVI